MGSRFIWRESGVDGVDSVRFQPKYFGLFQVSDNRLWRSLFHFYCLLSYLGLPPATYFQETLPHRPFFWAGSSSEVFNIGTVSDFFPNFIRQVLVFLKSASFKISPLRADTNLSKLFITVFKHSLVFFLITYAVMICTYGFRLDAVFLYLDGLKTLQEMYFSIPERHLNYSLGVYSAQPQWFYPFIVFLVKTPVPLFILLVLVLGTATKLGKNCSNELHLLIPIAIVFTSSFFDTENTGLRRILPIYPFIFVLVAKLVPYLEDLKQKNTGLINKQILVSSSVILIFWYIFSSVKTFPDYLTYFNDFAGGPKNGIYYLDNSNMDWGQDLKRLKPYMEEQGIEKIKLLYFGTADPNYYRINTEPLTAKEIQIGPQSGYYAISINYLNRLRRSPSAVGFGDGWKKEYKPVKIIGNTIYIFKIDSP
mgnify:FL=1